MEASAIIVAGGSGARFGTKKQFINLGGIPILRRTALCFDSHPFITHIVIVVPPEDIEQARQILVGLITPLEVTAGGATRQESVYNGLQIATSADVVLIHDGVRPLVSQSLISRVLAGIGVHDACIPGIKAADTLKEVEGELVVKTIPREHVYQVQTPQAFNRASILKAHTFARDHNVGNFTDDSALIENTGGKVGLVSGDPFNIKITIKEDIYIAEAILRCHTESD